jgi:hypothetical protein
LKILRFQTNDPEKVLAFLEAAKHKAVAGNYTFCAMVLANDEEFDMGWVSEESSRVRALQGLGLLQTLVTEFSISEIQPLMRGDR